MAFVQRHGLLPFGHGQRITLWPRGRPCLSAYICRTVWCSSAPAVNFIFLLSNLQSSQCFWEEPDWRFFVGGSSSRALIFRFACFFFVTKSQCTPSRGTSSWWAGICSRAVSPSFCSVFVPHPRPTLLLAAGLFNCTEARVRFVWGTSSAKFR